MAHFSKVTLPNGLRIILAPQKDSVAATVLVLVAAGSKYETKEINGLSHFLEHMCFKGTTKRPHAHDISGELDGLGASYNAFTSRESTGYYAKVQARHIDKVLDIIPDIYMNPLFDKSEIDKERGVIIEEINMYEDLPTHRVQELFMELLYGDQPAGWDVAGEKEIIDRLTQEDFLNYRARHYVASATVVVLAGKFDEERAIEAIKEKFKDISRDQKHDKIGVRETQNMPQVALKYKESDQSHLVLGVRAYPIFDKRRYILQVLVDILGGGMSSRLFQKIRDELGAAYYVKADADLYSDHGYVAVSVGAQHQKLETVISAIIGEFKRMASEEVESAELQRAKDHLSGATLLGLETSDALAGFYGGQEIIENSILTPEEILGKIQSVTTSDIMNVARDIFKSRALNLALIGPFKEKEQFIKLLTL